MATEQEGHMPRPVTISKCACGDPVCGQYTLSTQGSVGFSLADATLYAAAPDLLEALREAKGLADMAVMSDDRDGTPSDDQQDLVRLRAKIDAAIARATGEA